MVTIDSSILISL